MFTPYGAYRKSCDFQRYMHVQVQEMPLPSMSMEAEVLLNRMGLSFSYSNELWIRLTRYWKQFLLYHQRQAEADGADTSSLEAATSQVGWLLQCNTAGWSGGMFNTGRLLACAAAADKQLEDKALTSYEFTPTTQLQKGETQQ